MREGASHVVARTIFPRSVRLLEGVLIPIMKQAGLIIVIADPSPVMFSGARARARMVPRETTQERTKAPKRELEKAKAARAKGRARPPMPRRLLTLRLLEYQHCRELPVFHVKPLGLTAGPMFT